MTWAYKSVVSKASWQAVNSDFVKMVMATPSSRLVNSSQSSKSSAARSSTKNRKTITPLPSPRTELPPRAGVVESKQQPIHGIRIQDGGFTLTLKVGKLCKDCSQGCDRPCKQATSKMFVLSTSDEGDKVATPRPKAVKLVLKERKDSMSPSPALATKRKFSSIERIV